ncbi:hypothetical protein E4T56_gene251 [Termitomyces sp. T112]|nr:hypothetical protein E4T56_gene251 [Termitomyces sp. T112]
MPNPTPLSQTTPHPSHTFSTSSTSLQILNLASPRLRPDSSDNSIIRLSPITLPKKRPPSKLALPPIGIKLNPAAPLTIMLDSKTNAMPQIIETTSGIRCHMPQSHPQSPSPTTVPLLSLNAKSLTLWSTPKHHLSTPTHKRNTPEHDFDQDQHSRAQQSPIDKPHPATPTTIKKDPRHSATHVGIKAGPPEDLCPPTSHTNKRLKPRPPQTHVKDLDVHPPEPAQCTSLPQTEEKPLHSGSEAPRIKPSNATQKHHGTPQEDSQHPHRALELFLRHSAPSQQPQD